MNLPKIKGLIKRRILINYQIAPEIVSSLLPSKFNPKIINGKAIIGICLIRLEQIRPFNVPIRFGISSENVAHRIAVQWEDSLENVKDGVFIFRRDSNSWLNTLLGGRLFPGEHSHASFIVEETSEYIDLKVSSSDQKVKIHVRGAYTHINENSTIFQSVGALSEFFQSGVEGYSPVKGKDCYHGMCLIPYEWNMRLLKKEILEVSYFRDELRLDDEQLIFDSIVIMKDIPHEWRSMKSIVG